MNYVSFVVKAVEQGFIIVAQAENSEHVASKQFFLLLFCHARLWVAEKKSPGNAEKPTYEEMNSRSTYSRDVNNADTFTRDETEVPVAFNGWPA